MFYWQTGSCSSIQEFHRCEISEILRFFTKIRHWLLLRIKQIENVKNTEFNFITIVTGKALLFTCRTYPLYVVHFSYFSKVLMCTHVCSCWSLNLKLNEMSPNQILKAGFKNVLFVIVALNDKKLCVCVVTIFLSSITHE